jgi:hypothetical protein
MNTVGDVRIKKETLRYFIIPKTLLEETGSFEITTKRVSAKAPSKCGR